MRIRYYILQISIFIQLVTGFIDTWMPDLKSDLKTIDFMWRRCEKKNILCWEIGVCPWLEVRKSTLRDGVSEGCLQVDTCRDRLNVQCKVWNLRTNRQTNNEEMKADNEKWKPIIRMWKTLGWQALCIGNNQKWLQNQGLFTCNNISWSRISIEYVFSAQDDALPSQNLCDTVRYLLFHTLVELRWTPLNSVKLR